MSRFLASIAGALLAIGGLASADERGAVHPIALAMGDASHLCGTLGAAVQVTVIVAPTEIRELQASGIAAHELPE